MFELKNWAVVSRKDPYLAPELRSKCLTGQVYGNPRFPNGVIVTTSPIQGIVKTKDTALVSTKNSQYIVCRETVLPEYEEEFTNAFDRLSIEYIVEGAFNV